MKKTTILLFCAVLAFGCGGTANNTANQARSNSNATNSNASESSNTNSTAKTVDPTPISKDAFDFYMMVKESSDPKELVGRTVNITDLDLKEIESSTLHLGYSWYFFVDCEGSFGDYLSVKDVVAKRAKDKPVLATIRGVIKEASKENVKLEPCVMTDVKK